MQTLLLPVHAYRSILTSSATRAFSRLAFAAVVCLTLMSAAGGCKSASERRPPAPFGFSLTAGGVADGATDASVTPTLTWGASLDVVDYTLEINTTTNFNGAITHRKEEILFTATSYTVPGGALQTGTKYYWRVIAYNGHGKTVAANAPFSFTTATPPSAFNMLTPADGVEGESLTPELTWADTNGETSYTIEIDTDADFGAPLTHQITGLAAGTTSYVVPGGELDPGVTYFWRARAVNGAGIVNAGNAPFSFTTSTDTWLPTTDTAAPDARIGHVAVWTGDSMLVWGGNNGLFDLNSGAIYEPAVDAWTAMSTVNGDGAPAARVGATAVWTGSELLVWGGTDGGALNTGGRYNPVTDSWTTISAANGDGAPDARFDHSAVWTGSVMIVWGGHNGTNPLNDGGMYDPITDSWTDLPSGGAPAARSNHTAVWTGADMIVWGGADGGGELLSGSRYNLIANTWSAVTAASAPTARSGHTAVWTGARMLVFGGLNTGLPLNTGGAYDPNANAWTAISGTNAPSARSNHSTIWSGGEMIVWGGLDAMSLPLGDGGKYSPDTDTWRQTSPDDAPDARSEHSAVWTGSEMILWGGVDAEMRLNSGGRYQTDTFGNAWSNTSVSLGVDPLTERFGHSATWTGAGMVVWGGNDGAMELATGASYNPVTDAWTATTDTGAPDARRNHAAAWTGSQVAIWGGFDGTVRVDTGALYDPFDDAWASMSTANGDGAPDAREFAAAVWTGRELIVWGGFDGTNHLNTGGRYDLATDSWTDMSTAGAPDGRIGFAAVWTGARLLVWGGFGDGDTYFNDGALYDPVSNTWSAISVVNGDGAPDARSDFAFAWTGSELIVWGGRDDMGSFADGARYSPIDDEWTTLTAVDAPLARFNVTGIWTGAAFIVWGGEDAAETNTGGMYSPADDSWFPTANIGAPATRTLHTAVWTGTSMIVWGGSATGLPLSSGAQLK